jgi:ribonuclease HI
MHRQFRISSLKRYHSTKRAIIYTDGSYINGQGGIGIHFTNAMHADISENYSMWIDPVKFPPTSNRCELLAIYRTFSICLGKGINAEIHTDSEYAINSITRHSHVWNENGWFRLDGTPVKNIDLIMPLYLVHSRMDNQFVFKHVKSHQNLNESSHTIANSLAKMGGQRE